MRIGLKVSRIIKNSVYLYDNDYDDVTIVLALEDEEKLNYDGETIYNSANDFVKVLINNQVDYVLVADLFSIQGE